MKIVHIESGLGNQMLSYCELLALRHIQEEDCCYIETIVYDIPEANDYICQWNGYELERIFGIKELNVSSLFSAKQWKLIMDDLVQSSFWKKNWNYPVYITQAFEHQGLTVKNIRGNFEKSHIDNVLIRKKNPCSYYIKQSSAYTNIRRIYLLLDKSRHKKVDINNLFYSETNNVFTGQRLTFKFNGNDIEKIDKDIRLVFRFPEFSDEKNKEMSEYLKSVNSIAIHARRGDMLSVNGKYYKCGYFKRAVKFIMKNVNNPEFFFFCDHGSIDWCKQNGRIFGLNFKRDKVNFVDWNKGDQSFRDMQLMAQCKHNIITNSSFGWWGSYLNTNPSKITISPEININTTHHF